MIQLSKGEETTQCTLEQKAFLLSPLKYEKKSLARLKTQSQ